MGRGTGGRLGGAGFWIHRAREPGGARPLSPHFHDEYLICAQIRGDEDCRIGRRTHHLRAGDLVLINPQEVHTGHAAATEGLEYVSLHVDRERVAEVAGELGGGRTPEFVAVQVGGQAEMIEALCGLWAASRARAADPLAALEVDAAVTRVLGEALLAFSDVRAPERRPRARARHPRLARAIEALRASEVGEPPPLAALAAAAELSKFHFLRVFRAEVGMTPGAYARTLRICRAARAIRREGRSPREAAALAGFRNATSFARAFKAIVGVPPSALRRLAGGG